MRPRHLIWTWPAILALLLLFAGMLTATLGQTGGPTTYAHPANGAQTPQPAPSAIPIQPRTSSAVSASQPRATSAASAVPATPTTQPDCESSPCDYQPAHITIATPAPAPAPWTLQERVQWVAIILLVILAYTAILLALSLLRKIERQSRYGEAAAQAAAETAQAAVLQVHATIRAERPWVLIAVEPSLSIENGFAVTATNRGRSPARIVNTVDKITTAIDQAHLPETPQYDDAAPNAALASVILLPGESIGIKTFSRENVKSVCLTEEKLNRVERWQEHILLYGKVTYKDLVTLEEKQTYESSWCCWYIHGRQKSGMVMAGPPKYNRHT
jgi:hypothetical protein